MTAQVPKRKTNISKLELDLVMRFWMRSKQAWMINVNVINWLQVKPKYLVIINIHWDFWEIHKDIEKYFSHIMSLLKNLLPTTDQNAKFIFSVYSNDRFLVDPPKIPKTLRKCKKSRLKMKIIFSVYSKAKFWISREIYSLIYEPKLRP